MRVYLLTRVNGGRTSLANLTSLFIGTHTLVRDREPHHHQPQKPRPGYRAEADQRDPVGSPCSIPAREPMF